MSKVINVATKFQGPPGTGNGGYISGLLANHLGASLWSAGIEVTLRAPTPLEQPLKIETADGKARCYADDLLIGEAIPAEFALEIPEPPPFAQAQAVQANSPALQADIENIVPGGLGFHPVCFCCGADVPEGQGLRVFAAPVSGFSGVAAAWRPHPQFGDADGLLPLEIVWAALDCPGQFAFLVDGVRTGLLGRMTAKVVQPVHADEEIVITGWCISVEGKKHFAGTALFNQQGDCCAYSKQVWIGRRD